MEPGSFEQRRLLTRRTYVVGPNGVAYEHRTPFSKFAGTVRFDEMGPELHEWTSGAGVRLLWGAGVLLVFAVILVAGVQVTASHARTPWPPCGSDWHWLHWDAGS